MIRRLIIALCAVLLPFGAAAESYPAVKRIVAVGGAVTETVYLLGQQHRLIARDTTSVFPPDAQALPDVGYMRRLSAEGVLSVDPDLIIARDTSGPVEVIDLLREASIPVVFTHDSFSAEAVVDNIRVVGRALGTPERAEELARGIEADLAALKQEIAQLSERKRVMFVLSAENGKLNVAGDDTGADGMIRLAGAVNVMSGQYSGYKTVTDEAIIKSAPEVVIMMTGRAEHEGRKDEILSLPAVALTPATQNGGFVLLDGSALGFGPRTADAARDLHARIYGQSEH